MSAQDRRDIDGGVLAAQEALSSTLPGVLPVLALFGAFFKDVNRIADDVDALAANAKGVPPKPPVGTPAHK